MGRSVRVRGAGGSVARCVRLVGGDGCSSDSRSPIGVVKGSVRWVVVGGAFLSVRGAGLATTRLH